jgi:hypothetical protein
MNGCQFSDFHQSPLGRSPREHQPGTGEGLTKRVVELIPVTVPLEYDRLVVGVPSARVRSKLAGIDPEAHRRPLVFDVTLLREQVDHRVAAKEIEFS